MSDMKHITPLDMDWCIRCGRPALEIVGQQIRECDGAPDVVHERYVAARRDAMRLMRPIYEAVLNQFRAGAP